tara:strand:- start:770 stop:1474 length:705 start_codon:yes stop_codon:yes gene_type:complete
MLVFHFKQFSIDQTDAPFKVGTDSVILGSWVSLTGDETVLDIGTGTGVLALMVAQRIAMGHVLAIEPEREAFLIAEQNFINSEFKNRLVAVNEPLQKIVTSSKFDMIISNPPYFIDSTKKAHPSASRARHTVALTFSEIIEFGFHHLTESGRLNVVLPVNEAKIFEEEALQRGFYKSRELLVSSFEGSVVKRKCTEYALEKGAFVEEQLHIRDREGNVYSEEYRALTKEYHTRF